MKPVFQTRFGYPDGNCHAAALASVLEIEIDAIPEFGIDPTWYDAFSRYMVSHHALQPFDVDANSLPPGDTIRGYYLINGKSPRGDFWHTIVGFNGEAVHDPLPNGNCELKTVETFTVFLVIDPKTMAWENIAPKDSCDHDWHGPCIDDISRYYKCKKCFAMIRDE